jgi:hypothetical protein
MTAEVNDVWYDGLQLRALLAAPPPRHLQLSSRTHLGALGNFSPTDILELQVRPTRDYLYYYYYHYHIALKSHTPKIHSSDSRRYGGEYLSSDTKSASKLMLV